MQKTISKAKLKAGVMLPIIANLITRHARNVPPVALRVLKSMNEVNSEIAMKSVFDYYTSEADKVREAIGESNYVRALCHRFRYFAGVMAQNTQGMRAVMAYVSPQACFAAPKHVDMLEAIEATDITVWDDGTVDLILGTE